MEEEIGRRIIGNQLFITYRKIDRGNPVEDFETIQTRCYPVSKEEKKDVIVPFKRQKEKKTIPGFLFFAHEVEV